MDCNVITDAIKIQYIKVTSQRIYYHQFKTPRLGACILTNTMDDRNLSLIRKTSLPIIRI